MSKATAKPDSTVPVHGLPSPATRWKVQCLNCGYELHGQFCSHCGQRAVPPHPTVRELAGDALSEFSGWDGKFAETIRTLVRKPGELTRQWLDGRRAHFISPLRLYLTASLLFFLVQGSAPRLTKEARDVFSVDTRTRPGQATAVASRSMDGDALTGAERDSALAAVAKAPPVLRQMLQKMIQDPAGMRDGARKMVPRMFFVLLPLYAGILALFYRRRHYPEHLYFAIHLHSFVFLALMLAELTKFTWNVKLSAVAGIAGLLWIAWYSLKSLRTVYGGSWGGTILKGIGIMIVYLMVALPVMFLTILAATFF